MQTLFVMSHFYYYWLTMISGAEELEIYSIRQFVRVKDSLFETTIHYLCIDKPFVWFIWVGTLFCNSVTMTGQVELQQKKNYIKMAYVIKRQTDNRKILVLLSKGKRHQILLIFLLFGWRYYFQCPLGCHVTAYSFYF